MNDVYNFLKKFRSNVRNSYGEKSVVTRLQSTAKLATTSQTSGMVVTQKQFNFDGTN